MKNKPQINASPSEPGPHLAWTTVVVFQSIRLNKYFSKVVDNKTSPPTITYKAESPPNVAASWEFKVSITLHYKPEPNAVSPWELPIKMSAGDEVVVIGNVAHFRTSKPEIGI